MNTHGCRILKTLGNQASLVMCLNETMLSTSPQHFWIRISAAAPVRLLLQLLMDAAADEQERVCHLVDHTVRIRWYAPACSI